MKRQLLFWISCCIGIFSGCQIVLPPLPPPTENPLPPRLGDPQSSVDFAKHIKPIFEYRCVRCHHSDNPQAGLNLQDPTVVLIGTRTGTDARFIVAGDPEKSLVYLAATRPNVHPKMMPNDGWGLTNTHKQRLREWIEQGAVWPSGSAGRLVDRAFDSR